MVSSATGLAQLPTLRGWWSVHFIEGDCRTLIGPTRLGSDQGPTVVRFRHVRALLPNRRQAGDH